MSDVRKVISFTAVDAGVSAMFDKARQASAKYTAAVINDAKKAAEAIQQQWKPTTEAAQAPAPTRSGANTGERAEQQTWMRGQWRGDATMRRNNARFRQTNPEVYDDVFGRHRANPRFAGRMPAEQAEEPRASLLGEDSEAANDRRNDKRQYWRGNAVSRRKAAQQRSEGSGESEPEKAETTDTPAAEERKFASRHEAEAHQLADELVGEAMSFSEDVKEQTKYLRDKIKEIRQINSADTKQALVDNDVARDQAMAAAGDDKEKIKEANDTYRDSNREVRKGQREGALQVQLLQGIIDAVHQSAIVEADTQKRSTDSLVEESNESQAQQDQEDKKEDTRAADEEADDAFNDQPSPADDTPGDPEPRRRGFFGTLFGRVDDDYEDDNPADDEEGEEESSGKKGKKKKQGGRRLYGAGLASQSTGALASATGFAAFASIGGIIAKLIHEGGELEKSGGRMRGMTGVGYENYDLKGGAEGYLGIGKSADYGVKRADFMAYSTDLAAKRGYATAGYDASGKTFNSGLEGETNKLMSTEIGFGLPSGYLSGLARHQSFDTNRRETSGDVQNLVKIMGASGQFRGGDFSRLAELLETSNQIAEDQSGYLEQINSDKNAGIMAGVSRLGGSFADQRMGARISTLQSALRTPDNDFKQADAYAVLRRQNPKKSFFELQEEQDKGLGAKGYMSGVMKDIVSRGGSEDYKMQMVKSRFGLSPSQARRLYQGYKANPDVFNFDQYAKAAGKGDMDMLGRAKAVTPAIPIGLAKMDDVAAKAGDKTIGVLADMAKWVEDKVPTIVDGMKSVGDAAGTAAKQISSFGARAEKLLNKVENKMHWLD